MIQVINRCLNILEVLSEKEEGFGVLELAKRISLPGSTVHRILNALKKHDYIFQDPETEKYQLGYKIVTLAGKTAKNRSLKRLALPYLKKLKDETDETVHLIMMEGENAVCVESVESSNNMRVCSPVGENNPLHCTAVGKAILANFPPDEQERFFPIKLKRYTVNTITSFGKLRNELNVVKERGYAIDREEYQQGISCIAAPIKDFRDKVVAALGISFPSFRVDKIKEEEFISGVKEIACQISKECGSR